MEPVSGEINLLKTRADKDKPPNELMGGFKIEFSHPFYNVVFASTLKRLDNGSRFGYMSAMISSTGDVISTNASFESVGVVENMNVGAMLQFT